MTAEGRGSLRLRLFAIVLAAALAPMAPLAIALLLQVRDALYSRRIADGRAQLQAVAEAVRSRCKGGQQDCAQAAARSLGASFVSRPCPSRTARLSGGVVLCTAAPGGSIELREDLEPVREQLQALDLRILVTLLGFVAVLVALAVWLLERGFVRRLEQVDFALSTVGAEQEEGPALLPEGGDAVGRVAAAVNRLAQRLREERTRIRAQIEALKAANEQLSLAREDLQRSERLASVGRLAAGVAHEVGNPVAALIGYAALMRERLAQGKDVAGYAERVEREATRIDRILRDLLDLARPREARLLPVDLRRAAGEAKSVIEPQPVWGGVRLVIDLPPELPAALGEDHYVVQVLVNLLANAARAGASEVLLTARSAAGEVLLEVADDGPGIADDALPRLFEPFFTTAAPGHGTGLGLALCHATMERIGGGISARNGARGAVFTLRFQAAPS